MAETVFMDIFANKPDMDLIKRMHDSGTCCAVVDGKTLLAYETVYALIGYLPIR
jgi:hypothetical protein